MRSGPRERIATGTACLLGLALLLPFETPLFPLGPLVVTSTEFLLYLSLLGWAVSTAASAITSGWSLTGHARAALAGVARDPIARAVALWLAVTALSAATAPSHRTAAIKFALRTTTGVLLYFAARDLIRPSSFRRRELVVVLLGGAVLSASLTFLESARPDWTSWWHLFRPQEFSGIGFTRASGTFAFPNIAAMYWEASLPLTLVVLAVGSGVLRSTPRRWMPLGAGVLLSVILLHGILATASRAALGEAALSACALLVLGRSAGGSRRDVRLLACAILVVEIVLIVATLVRGGPDFPLAQRLGWHPSAPADVLSGEDSSTAARERGQVVALAGDQREPPALPSRPQLWAAALRLWRQHPLLGVGPDNFRHRYPEVIAATGGAHFDDERIHANNFYLETVADLGLAGVLVLALLAHGLWRAARTTLARGTGPLELGVVVAIGTFFVHGCVDYFFEFTPTFGLWWLLLALVGPSDQPTDAAQVGPSRTTAEG